MDFDSSFERTLRNLTTLVAYELTGIQNLPPLGRSEPIDYINQSSSSRKKGCSGMVWSLWLCSFAGEADGKLGFARLGLAANFAFVALDDFVGNR